MTPLMPALRRRPHRFAIALSAIVCASALPPVRALGATPSAVPAVAAPSSALPANAAPSGHAEETPLPPEVLAALQRADLPPRALAAWVQPLDGARPVLAWNADLPVNPASVFKLVTTSAALDLLGPAYTWSTPVAVTGPIRRGVLHGSLVIQGRGDPKLVMERLWLLLRQVRDLGIREIAGDVVLDDGAFAPPEGTPADFDGEPWHPYNVLPDALLLNYKAVTLGFTPDPDGKVAHVSAEPPLAGVAVPPTVPLARGGCDDWRGALKLDSADAARWHFAGAYAAACGPRTWPVAYADPARYDARLVEALWHELGGTLRGQVVGGPMPADATPAFSFASPPLADVIRDVNKFSNNVMAEQIFLTLALQRPGRDAAAPATVVEARGVLQRWLRERLGPETDDTVVVNGSGLARETRIRARTLARLLQWIEASPTAPELLSSLPVAGVDGTLRRSAAATGRGHLKTGSMRDVQAVAGEVVDVHGRRWIVVAIVNDAKAPAARPALEALLGWVAAGPPAR